MSHRTYQGRKTAALSTDRAATSRLYPRLAQEWQALLPLACPLNSVRQWRIVCMRFVETPIFTERVVELLSDESYRGLQAALVLRPEAGAVIPGARGLRKIRWRQAAGGKRGGLRVIYYWAAAEDVIFMLLAYRKSRQDDLTPEQVKILQELVKEWLE